jgi:hypothetical protein
MIRTLTANALLLVLAPNPGAGTPPPGAAKITTVLGWLAWLVFAACVAGILFCAGKMAVNHRRGEGAEHAAGLAYTLAACIVAGSASAIVGLMV